MTDKLLTKAIMGALGLALLAACVFFAGCAMNQSIKGMSQVHCSEDQLVTVNMRMSLCIRAGFNGPSCFTDAVEAVCGEPQ